MSAAFNLHAWQYEVLFGESDREADLVRRGVLVRRNLAVVPPGSLIVSHVASRTGRNPNEDAS